jgi:hypothetical protein
VKRLDCSLSRHNREREAPPTDETEESARRKGDCRKAGGALNVLLKLYKTLANVSEGRAEYSENILRGQKQGFGYHVFSSFERVF